MILNAAARVPNDQLEESLRELTRRLQWHLSPEQRARLMNMAADLCIEAGETDRAILYLDAAIDLYLMAGRFAAGAGICEKLTRLKPNVVRARCTLAWLAIARGLEDEAQRRIDEYGDAALRLENPEIAREQLRAMAEEVDSQQVLESIAAALTKLDDAESADRVFGMIDTLAERRAQPRPAGPARDRAIVARVTSAWAG